MGFLREILTLNKRVSHKTNPRTESAIKILTNGLNMTEVTANTVGAFGKMIFEVSSLKVKTLKDVKRTTKARYATHDIVGQKSMLEFLGTAPDEITFDMQWNEDLGVDIEEEMGNLLDMQRSGDANYLFLGTHAYGTYKWVIESVTFNHEYADKYGNPYFMTASVTLKEQRQ